MLTYALFSFPQSLKARKQSMEAQLRESPGLWTFCVSRLARLAYRLVGVWRAEVPTRSRSSPRWRSGVRRGNLRLEVGVFFGVGARFRSDLKERQGEHRSLYFWGGFQSMCQNLSLPHADKSDGCKRGNTTRFIVGRASGIDTFKGKPAKKHYEIGVMNSEGPNRFQFGLLLLVKSSTGNTTQTDESLLEKMDRTNKLP